MHGMNDVTLHTVRELGFNNHFGIERSSTEIVFFMGPVLANGRRVDGAHATEEAILDFIAYYKNQIQVAKDYLANGRNNKTHEWTRSSRDCKPSVEALSSVQEILREKGHINIGVDQLLYGARIVDELVSIKDVKPVRLTTTKSGGEE
jgi:hypothetical protein